MNVARIFKHLLAPQWLTRRAFPASVLSGIAAVVAEVEKNHGGELRFAIEGGLDFLDLWRGVSPRARAVEMFSRLGVWDTEYNNGVLIYVQFIDRCVEIVADRGIAARVPQSEWDNVCRAMEDAFRHGAYGEGAVKAIRSIGAILAKHFPAHAETTNELPDRPVLL